MATKSEGRRIAGCGLGAALVALVAGCSATAPDSRVAAVARMAPEGWSASREARAGVDNGWLRRFGDPQLAKLVDEAMADNPDLGVAAERVRRSQAVARLAGAEMKPQLQGQFTGRAQKQNLVGFPFPGGQSFVSESYGTSLDINWELDVWGRVRAAQGAAVADAQAGAMELEAARTSLAAQLAKAWFALGEANEQIELAREAVETRGLVATAFEERFERAIDDQGGTASQVRLAQTDLESSRATLALWEGERQRALRQIELLAGRYPEGKGWTSAGLPSPPPAPPAGLPSELLLRRPDLLAAERRLAAAGRRADSARRARFPRFSLTGSRGTSSDSLDEVLDSRFGVWSLGGGLVQPIFSGGRLLGEQRVAESDERIALRELQRDVLRAFGEVEQALVAEVYFAKRVEALSETARLASAAAEAAVQDFTDGVVDALTLLQAQDRKIQTGLSLASLRRARLDNRVNLHLALGGDFKLRGE